MYDIFFFRGFATLVAFEQDDISQSTLILAKNTYQSALWDNPDTPVNISPALMLIKDVVLGVTDVIQGDLQH